MSWQEIRVGDLGEIITGKTPPTSNVDNYGGNIPFITPSDMVGNRSIVSTERYISEKGKNTIKNSILPPHAVCVSCIGSDMGKVVLTTAWSATNQQINSIVCNSHYDYRFVYYLMLTLRETIKSLGKNATAVPILNKTKFSNIQVAVPSLPIQKRIADFLSYYDDLIENNKKQIKLLEEAAQRLYKEWFVDLRFPGRETTPIVDGVPEGWTRCCLENVISFNPKVSLSKERLKQSVPMSALSTTSMILDFNEFTTTYSNAGSKFQNGDTLLARITPCLENGKTAFVSGIESSEGAVGSTEYIVMREKEINPYMVYLLARTEDFRQAAINSMTGSDGRQRAQVDKLKTLPYLKPTIQVIELFARCVEPMFIQIQTKNRQNMELKQARDRLLPKLMSGEIEV